MTGHAGQRLGNYRLLRLVGQGGFADVYLSQHIHLDTYAAVKVLRTHLNTEDAENFRREALTIAHLTHPHIVRMHDYGIEEGTPFLILDHAPGGSIRQKYARGTRLPVKTIVSYVKQAAAALQYAHDRKLIHRDIKPENMLLNEQNEILLSDFGMAVILQSSHNQDPLHTAGTIQYMAPEQLQGRPKLASDQYSLAVVAYEWFCGRCPFNGTFSEIASQHVLIAPSSLREHVPYLPAKIEKVILKALEKEPEQRFSSVQAFAQALEEAYEASKHELILAESDTVLIAQISPATAASSLQIPREFSSETHLLPAELQELHTQRLPPVKPVTPPVTPKIQSALPLSPPPVANLFSITTSLKIGQKKTRRKLFFVSSAVLVALAAICILIPLLINILHTPPKLPAQVFHPTLTLSTNDAKIGQDIHLHLTTFSPSSPICLMHDTQEIIQVASGSSFFNSTANGSADIKLVLTPDWQPGFHSITAEDVKTHFVASATLHISEGPTRPGHLVINNTFLDLGPDTQGANTFQPLVLENGGGGSISWQASSDQPWLFISPAQGSFSTRQQITIGVSRANLTPGDYSGTVTFSSNLQDTQKVTVIMKVNPLPNKAGAVLSITPPTLSFTALDGDPDPTPQPLVISNSGTEKLNWSLAHNTPSTNTENWLETDQASGTLEPHQSSTLNVKVHIHNLLAGTYTSTLVFNSDKNTVNSSQTVSVSLSIQPSCSLQVNRGSLTFNVNPLQGTPESQLIKLSPTANCTQVLDWKAKSTASWLAVKPAEGQFKNGSESTDVTIGVGIRGLAPGTYNGTVILSTAQSSQTINVQLIIESIKNAKAPIMQLSPQNLLFSTTQGEKNTLTQTTRLTNKGLGTLQWYTAPKPMTYYKWYAIKPGSGKIAAGQSQSIEVILYPQGLVPGTYNVDIILMGSDEKDFPASGSPQTITVSLTIKAPCSLSQPSPEALAFNVKQGSTDPVVQTLNLTAYGDCSWPLSWSISVANQASWLKASPVTGSLVTSGQTASLSIAISTTGLSSGTYQTQISIWGSDSNGQAVPGSPGLCTVSLTVTSQSALQTTATPSG